MLLKKAVRGSWGKVSQKKGYGTKVKLLWDFNSIQHAKLKNFLKQREDKECSRTRGIAKKRRASSTEGVPGRRQEKTRKRQVTREAYGIHRLEKKVPTEKNGAALRGKRTIIIRQRTTAGNDLFPFQGSCRRVKKAQSEKKKRFSEGKVFQFRGRTRGSNLRPLPPLRINREVEKREKR